MSDVVLDASHQILGRFSSKVASRLLDSEEVSVINTEELVITGKPKNIIEKYANRKRRGDPHHGPYYPKEPKRIFKRTVKGMVPHKKKKGEEALERLSVFNDNPEEVDGERISKDRNDITCQHISLGELSGRLKGE